MTGIVVIGVGNAYRGDDAVGLAISERLRERVRAGVTIMDCEQEPTRLLDAWQDADVALVVDATTSGAAPGTVRRFDASSGRVPAHVFRSSTHAFGVGDAVELARALGRLPERVVVYGIEGADFTAGCGLSTQVAAAVQRVVDELEQEIGPVGAADNP